MTRSIQEAALELAAENDIEARAYEGKYSGRGMFGLTTCAIVVQDPKDAGRLEQLLIQAGFDVGVGGFSWDNLGLEFVVY